MNLGSQNVADLGFGLEGLRVVRKFEARVLARVCTSLSLFATSSARRASGVADPRWASGSAANWTEPGTWAGSWPCVIRMPPERHWMVRIGSE